MTDAPNSRDASQASTGSIANSQPGGEHPSAQEAGAQDGSAEAPAVSATEGAGVTREQVIEALKTVEDPELFLDIWFLGLIYSIVISEEGEVDLEMTFTSPMCPAGPMLLDQVKQKVNAVPGVRETRVKVVFSPPWQPSDEVKAMLGLI